MHFKVLRCLISGKSNGNSSGLYYLAVNICSMQQAQSSFIQCRFIRPVSSNGSSHRCSRKLSDNEMKVLPHATAQHARTNHTHVSIQIYCVHLTALLFWSSGHARIMRNMPSLGLGFLQSRVSSFHLYVYFQSGFCKVCIIQAGCEPTPLTLRL
jgi:hypothetical protein